MTEGVIRPARPSSRDSEPRAGSAPERRTARPPVVVLGLSAAALPIIRSLARLGVEVRGIYADPVDELARHSRFLQARYRVPARGPDEPVLRMLERIGNRVDGSGMPILIATNDRFARLLSDHRARLERTFVFHLPSTRLMEAFLDKRALVELCRRYDIAIPRSCAPTEPEDVQHVSEAFTFPLIIKPARTTDDGFPGRNVVVTDAARLIGFFRSRPELIARSIIQEVVPSGDGYNLVVGSYSGRDGRVLALCTGRKLRQWPPDVGTNCYSVSETLPGLQRSMRAFLEDIGYVGFAGIEFAQDVRTGTPYFLELNPRVVYDYQLWTDAGVDLGLIAYLEMCGERRADGPGQRDGVHWIDVHRDIPSFVVTWLRGRLTLLEWLRSLRQASSFATWDRSDPMPFVASMMRLLVRGLGAGRGRGRPRPDSIPAVIRGEHR